MTQPISILTFNVRYGTANDGEHAWPYRQDAVARTVKLRPYDFICLQEALPQQVDFFQAQLGSHYDKIWRTRDADATTGESTPIFFNNTRWRCSLHEIFWLSETPHIAGSRSWGSRLPRIATCGCFIDNETEVVLLNTHLDHEYAEVRKNGIAVALRYLNKTFSSANNIVVTGDFNCEEHEPPVLDLLSTDLNLRDTWRVKNSSSSEGTFHQWTGRHDVPRIDYILSNAKNILEARILTETSLPVLASDHYPVEAMLEF